MVHWIQMMENAGIPFLIWLQSFQNDALTAIMRFFSYLGTEYFFLLLLPLLYWSISKRWGIMVALALIFAGYGMNLSKWLTNTPRPDAAKVAVLWHETSPSFVSGHAATAMAVWGTLGAVVRRTWFWIVAALLIFFIGLSRLYLGVHYPVDVVGGWLLGLMIAFWVVLLVPRWAPGLALRRTSFLLALALGAALLMLFLHPAGGIPRQWPASGAAQFAGLFLGMAAGLVWDVKKLHFLPSGPWWRRLLRLLAGLLVLAVFYVLPKLLFDALGDMPSLLAQVLRMLRYALVGWVVSGLAPWLFIRLRL